MINEKIIEYHKEETNYKKSSDSNQNPKEKEEISKITELINASPKKKENDGKEISNEDKENNKEINQKNDRNGPTLTKYTPLNQDSKPYNYKKIKDRQNNKEMNNIINNNNNFIKN